MRAVVQRVARASVAVDGDVVSSIGRGVLVYLGVHVDDGEGDLEWLVNKIASLRVFPDEEGKMNRSAEDVGGEALVVSQFTLHGDARKGARPSFASAAPPDRANALYERFLAELDRRIPSKGGRFQAHMAVDSINDGPVTILLDSKKTF